MDYEFFRDVTGQVQATFSMGHEAVGHWLNDEVADNFALLDDIELHIRQLTGLQNSWQCIGHEYTFWTDGDEVMIRANDLSFINDSLEEGMSYYDEESLSLCGTDDFLLMIKKYRDFYQL